jgi:DNA helicase-2/ATP-dependent DNA helicase PcrA
VDEFQDVNLAQYRLLQLLTGPDSNICLIGDPDQAIYGFRGATPEFFHQFSRDFPPVETLNLSRNYRSTQLILDASEQVIEKSPVSERVKIWSDFVDKTKLSVYRADSDRAEAEYTVHEIEKLVGGTSYFSIDSERVNDDDNLSGLTFADFAVLYRLGAQSQPLIEAFQRSGIPYQTIGQTPLVEYKEVRTVLACLWFLYNPKLSFHLEQLATKKQVQSITSFLAAIEDSTTTSVSVLIDQIHQVLTEQSILVIDEKSSERLQQLSRRAAPFENRLGDFLESMALEKETDLYDPRADRVTLMTLHAAKGLEFPVVFIVGCEETLLPYQRGDEEPDIEEERRLFYVGMTRAQQRLVLTHAVSRYLFGQQMNNLPSRFLDDIEQALKEMKKSPHRKPAKETPDHIQLKLF